MTQTIAPPPISPEIVQLDGRHAAVVHVAGAASELPSLLGKAFELTMAQVQASGAQVAGPPFARYLGFGDRIEAEVGFPYIGKLSPTEQVYDAVLPPGRAVIATHVGPYEEIGAAWHRLERWLLAQGLSLASAPWESYLSGPEDPGQPVTQIVFPVH